MNIAGRSRRAIHAGGVIAAILEREFGSGDRAGRRFCVARFDLRDAPDGGRVRTDLIRVLGRELRRTDEAGWLTPDTLVVLLRGATVAGAAVFAERFLAGVPDRASLVCSLYSHKDDFTGRAALAAACAPELEDRPAAVICAV